MKLEHGFTVPVPVDDAWQVLLDVEQVAPCMPGASLESVEGDEFSGKVKVKVGPITVTYRGTASFTDKDEKAHRAVIKAKGKEARGSGTASATVTTSMSEQGGKTKVDVTTDLTVTGRPAQFGRGVMADVGEKLIGRFASCLADKIAAGEVGGGQAAGGDGASAAAPADASAATGEQAADGHRQGTTAVASGGAAPAGAVPPGPTVSSAAASETATPVAGSPAPSSRAAAAAPSARPAPAEAEPIDLFDTAGMPVLKRVAPVAAGVAALAAIVALVRRARR
jgi:carbon monoxide dehydrogenase subunit G